MNNFRNHIINASIQAKTALETLSELPVDVSRTLFVVNDKGALVGTVTDGDIRRGLLKGFLISDSIEKFMNSQFRYIKKSEDHDFYQLMKFREDAIRLVPVLDENFNIVKIIDSEVTQSLLPVSVLIMAGGRGERLKPFTDTQPKPMLKVGDKPIIEHNIDRLIKFGITEFYISVRYLAEQIKDYFGNGSSKGVSIRYIEEDTPLGTLGACSLIGEVSNPTILVMNSDILTDMDYEDFYKYFVSTESLMSVASFPYQVDIPYAVLELADEKRIVSFQEKPTYTYYSNAGIYLIRSELKKMVPQNTFYNATDLITALIEKGDNVSNYPLIGYWLDIGKHQDFTKAQHDIKHLKL